MTSRFLSFLLALLGMASSLAAQTSGPPRFLLESIVVEGVQRDAVRNIVTAESLLKTGREYTEQELREAVYRVKRLPFVLDAEFSLRKGGERGSYELVITVEETRLVFFSLDAGGIYDADDQRVGPDEDRVDWGAGATVGGRWFVGSQGLVFANVLGVEEIGPYSAQGGYTRYNLFGRGGFASAIVSTDISDENESDTYQGTLSVGIPIVGNHFLRADLDLYQADFDDSFFSSKSESQRLWLSWIYNTTDDPLFPTSGTRVDAGAGYSEYEQEYRYEDPLVGTVRAKGTTYAHELGISGEKHWSLTRRQSISAALGGYWSETSTGFADGYDGYEYWQGSVGIGHSTDLWGFEKTERFGDLRWENTLQILRSDSDDDFFGDSSTTDGRLTTGVVFRNAWGVTRLSFSYVDNLDRSFRVRNVL